MAVASPGGRSDLSVIAAGLFAEDATTIIALREELAEAKRWAAALREREAIALGRAIQAEAELQQLRGAREELDRLRPEVEALRLTHRSHEAELEVMRGTASRLAASEARHREAAHGAVLEGQIQTKGLQARLEARQMQAEMESRKRVAELEATLQEAQRMVRETSRGADSDCWLRLLRRRHGRTKMFTAFVLWYHEAFCDKENRDLWDMHVYYLGKQAATMGKVNTRIQSKYDVALFALTENQDRLLLSRGFRAWHMSASNQARLQESQVYEAHVKVMDGSALRRAARLLDFRENADKRQAAEKALQAWAEATPSRSRPAASSPARPWARG
mmetsp:Transcript_45499/g.134684  ORF Transcript_45499/g.134684 Transcript_45499/m.134684 type:complete len:332 (-) Transcript_45499:48-1043(-)